MDFKQYGLVPGYGFVFLFTSKHQYQLRNASYAEKELGEHQDEMLLHSCGMLYASYVGYILSRFSVLCHTVVANHLSLITWWSAQRSRRPWNYQPQAINVCLVYLHLAV